MAVKKETTNKAGTKDADTGTGQNTATSAEQSTATGTGQNTAASAEQSTTTGGGDSSTAGGDGNGDGDSQSQGAGPEAPNDNAKHELVTVTLKTSFYCHGKSASFTAGDEYECDAETAERLVSNNMAKR